MAQIRGTAGYQLGNQNNTFGGGMSGHARQDATNDPSPLDAIRAQTSKIEDWLDTISGPLKPYLPAIGRFLIVVTFLEDALRIMTQWNDQLVYLHDYRHSKQKTITCFEQTKFTSATRTDASSQYHEASRTSSSSSTSAR